MWDCDRHTDVSCVGFVKVTKTPGLRPATKGDLEEIHSLLQANIRKFHLSTILSLQEVEHWLLPRENVVDTYVVEVKENKVRMHFLKSGEV